MEIIRNDESPNSGDIISKDDMSLMDEVDFVNPANTGQRVITKIKTAVKDQHRVNVYVDGKFSFSLDIAQMADFKLKTGQILSARELEELISASNFGKLYARTLEYVFSRPHSIKEVRSHLKKKQHTRQLQAKKYKEYTERLKNDLGFRAKVREKQTRKRKIQGASFTVDADGGYTFRDNDGPSYAYNNENEYGAKRASLYPTKPAAPISNQDIEKVMCRLIERGYLDDLNFARYFVENRNIKKGISTKRLRIELLKKGVDEHIIEQVLAESPRDQSEEIRKIIEKKRRQNYDDRKLMQYLFRQGFDYELVRNLVLSETD